MRSIVLYFAVFVLSQALANDSKGEVEEDEAPTGVREPSPCEVCKYLAIELQGRLEETGKVRGFIETGHGLDPKQKKRKEYKKSELRLIEALQEPHVCDKILEYNVHAERKKSLRYSKGQSQTMQTLHGLVNKGVKVELGIPYEMWDQPSAEVTTMQRSCFTLVEEYEDVIEEWYWGDQMQPLIDFLCRDRVLKGKESGCLDEKFGPEGDGDNDNEEKPAKKIKRKGDLGTPDAGMPPTTSLHNDESAASVPATDEKDEL